MANAELFTIGQLARRTGVPARTIRFWSGIPAPQRARLLGQLETFTDTRVERYWQLLAIINGQPVPPAVVPGFEWLIAALRADLGHRANRGEGAT